ncbi:hypothetical protein GCM10022253_29920 [Sphingomonas endophytica]|uniref:Uncharacterized protein n=1 Tax=Sphingomonas endophytica TaxID=869719 RepID=A0ABR6NA56_9SPHN|nr:hypothetical protein [Sphingomonas endophytica]MBB5726642.1 hypothetical protein [Sphingomonas endophytica]
MVLNNLLRSGATTATDRDGKPLTLEAQQARDHLVSTLVAAVATGAGLDAHAAVTSAQIETQNNSERMADGSLKAVPPRPVPFSIEELTKRDPGGFGAAVKAIADAKDVSVDQLVAAYNEYVACKAAPGTACVTDADASLDKLATLYGQASDKAVQAQDLGSTLSNAASEFLDDLRSDYFQRVNGSVASIKDGWATLNNDSVYTSGDGVAANLNTLSGLASISGGAVQYVFSPILGSVDTMVGRPIATVSNGGIPSTTAGDGALAIGSLFLGPEVATGTRIGGAGTSEVLSLPDIEGALDITGPLRGGVNHEIDRLAQLGVPKNNTIWRPTQADMDSDAFKVIVGEPKFTDGGLPVGTIFDGTIGGNLEIKAGSSMLDSSYQLRLQTYKFLKADTPSTIETTRPINPSFQSYLNRWGVSVVRPK